MFTMENILLPTLLKQLFLHHTYKVWCSQYLGLPPNQKYKNPSGSAILLRQKAWMKRKAMILMGQNKDVKYPVHSSNKEPSTKLFGSSHPSSTVTIFVEFWETHDQWPNMIETQSIMVQLPLITEPWPILKVNGFCPGSFVLNETKKKHEYS